MRRLRRYFRQRGGIENIDAIDANRRMGDNKAAESRPSVRTVSPRQGAKALLIKRSVSKVLLRYFRESNKALRLSAQ